MSAQHHEGKQESHSTEDHLSQSKHNPPRRKMRDVSARQVVKPEEKSKSRGLFRGISMSGKGSASSRKKDRSPPDDSASGEDDEPGQSDNEKKSKSGRPKISRFRSWGK